MCVGFGDAWADNTVHHATTDSLRVHAPHGSIQCRRAGLRLAAVRAYVTDNAGASAACHMQKSP